MELFLKLQVKKITFLYFQSLSFIWDVVLAIGFICLSVLPYAYTNDIFQYKGAEWNARLFAIIMGSLLLLWFIARFFGTIIIYRYWKLLRALDGYGNDNDYWKWFFNFYQIFYIGYIYGFKCFSLRINFEIDDSGRDNS